MDTSMSQTIPRNLYPRIFKTLINTLGEDNIMKIVQIAESIEDLGLAPAKNVLTTKFSENNQTHQIHFSWNKFSRLTSNVPGPGLSSELSADSTMVLGCEAVNYSDLKIMSTKSSDNDSPSQSQETRLLRSPKRSRPRKRKSATGRSLTRHHDHKNSRGISNDLEPPTSDMNELAFQGETMRAALTNKTIPKPKDLGLTMLLKKELARDINLENKYKHAYHNFALRDPVYRTNEVLDPQFGLPKAKKFSYKIGQTVRVLNFPGGCWSSAKVVNLEIENNLIELKFNKNHFIKDVKKYLGQTNTCNETNTWNFSAFKDSLVTNIANPFIFTELETCTDKNGLMKLEHLKENDFIKYRNKPMRVKKVKASIITRHASYCKVIGEFMSDGSAVDLSNDELIEELVCYGIRDPAYLRNEIVSRNRNRSGSNTKITNQIKSSHHKILFQKNQKCHAFDVGFSWEKAKIIDLCYETESVKITYPNDSKIWDVWTKFDSPHLKEWDYFSENKEIGISKSSSGRVAYLEDFGFKYL